MMFPGPARRDGPACHAANGAFDPKRGVDVDDDCADDQEREERVQNAGEPDQAGGEVR